MSEEWGEVKVIGEKLFIYRDTESYSVVGIDGGLVDDWQNKRGSVWVEEDFSQNKSYLVYVDYNGRKRMYEADFIEDVGSAGVPYQTAIGQQGLFPERWLWWISPDMRRVGIGHGDQSNVNRSVNYPAHQDSVHFDAPINHSDVGYEHVDEFSYSDISAHMDSGWLNTTETYHYDRPFENHWDHTDYADAGLIPHEDNGYIDWPPNPEDYHADGPYSDRGHQDFSLGQDHWDHSDAESDPRYHGLTNPPYTHADGGYTDYYVPQPYHADSSYNDVTHQDSSIGTNHWDHNDHADGGASAHQDNGYTDMPPPGTMYHANSSYVDNTAQYNQNFSLGLNHYNYVDHANFSTTTQDQSARNWTDHVDLPRHADSSYTDTAHDDHTDGYSDHANSGHANSNPFPHTDKPWQDVGHIDFGHADDLYFPPYSDGGHSDVHGDHFDNHGDQPSHSDGHADSHGDHSDNHNDTHSDKPTSHINAVHYDTPIAGHQDHQDHSNVLHFDTSIFGHQDHQDHSNVMHHDTGVTYHQDHQDHSNVLHYDTPVESYIDQTHADSAREGVGHLDYFEHQDRVQEVNTSHGDYTDVTPHLDSPNEEHSDVNQHIDVGG